MRLFAGLLIAEVTVNESVAELRNILVILKAQQVSIT